MPALKRVILEEWDKISLLQIRRLIADMPRRCKVVVETGGIPIRNELW